MPITGGREPQKIRGHDQLQDLSQVPSKTKGKGSGISEIGQGRLSGDSSVTQGKDLSSKTITNLPTKSMTTDEALKQMDAAVLEVVTVVQDNIKYKPDPTKLKESLFKLKEAIDLYDKSRPFFPTFLLEWLNVGGFKDANKLYKDLFKEESESAAKVEKTEEAPTKVQQQPSIPRSFVESKQSMFITKVDEKNQTMIIQTLNAKSIRIPQNLPQPTTKENGKIDSENRIQGAGSITKKDISEEGFFKNDALNYGKRTFLSNTSDVRSEEGLFEDGKLVGGTRVFKDGRKEEIEL